MTEAHRDTDGLTTAPWYIQFFVRVGMPTAFASILLWFLLTNVTGTLTELKNSQVVVQQTQNQIIVNQGRIIELLVDAHRDGLRSQEVLTALCINSANSEPERTRCVMSGP